MSPDDIGKLTIAEVEAIVVRATAALTAFREAQAMLGGTSAPATPHVPKAAPPRVEMTADELAQREALLSGLRGGPYPPELAAAIDS